MIATIITIVIFCIIKLLITCLPTGVVQRIISNFEIHSKLREEYATITYNAEILDGERKSQIIQYFNDANFLEKHYIFPGNEELFLHPENGAIPLIIDINHAKKSVRLFVFFYKERIDVVKQFKKKIIAYSISSNSLSELFPS